MFGIEEVLLISVIVLVVFGPDKLPEVARVLGKASKEFRKVANTAKFTWDEISREAELQETQAKTRQVSDVGGKCPETGSSQEQGAEANKENLTCGGRSSTSDPAVSEDSVQDEGTLADQQAGEEQGNAPEAGCP